METGRPGRSVSQPPGEGLVARNQVVAVEMERREPVGPTFWG